MELVFDIETDDLNATKVWCIVAQNPVSGEVFKFPPDKLEEGYQFLTTADTLIGHNIINYDVPLIKEQFPDFTPTGKMVDTLVLSRLYYPHIAERDYERRPVGMPQRLYGRHSLEAWGYRLKCFKGDFGKSDSNDWSTYTPEMLDYCIQDTQVTLRLYELLKRRMQDYA